MGITPDPSEQVTNLIGQYVPITEALKVLLTLQGAPEKPWTLEELANENRQPLSVVEDYVKFLRESGLVTGDRSRLRFTPASSELAAAVDALARAYAERPVSVLRPWRLGTSMIAVLFMLNAIGAAWLDEEDERFAYVYVLRVVGYVLILFAIVGKNIFAVFKWR